MKLIVKNKLITVGEGSTVTDENYEEKFKVKGKVFSITRKKFIYDMTGNLQFMVRNKFWRFIKTSAFIYDNNNNLVGQLSNSDWDFKNKFKLEKSEKNVEISGNLIQFPNIKLNVSIDDKVVGTITKNFNIVRDAFTIDVEDGQDAAFLVALVIAIDNIWDARRNRNDD